VFGTAFESEFEGNHHIEDLLVRHDKRSFAEDGIANIGVEFAPIAGGGDFARRRVSVFDEGQFAKVFLPFQDPRSGGNLAIAQIRFQRIEFALEIASLFSEDDEAGTRDGAHHSGPKQCADTAGVVEKDVEGVDGGESGALSTDVGGDALGCAKECEGLVDQVGCEIEKDAAARARHFAPGADFGSGAIAVVGRFEPEDAAERAVNNSFAKGLEIGVKAAVVVDGEDATEFFREAEEFDCLQDGSGEWFIDDHVPAGFETALGEREMGLVGSGNGDEADAVDSEKFVQGANNAGVWMKLRGGIAGALKDGSEAKPRHRANDRRVERTAAEAETDKADVNHVSLSAEC